MGDQEERLIELLKDIREEVSAASALLVEIRDLLRQSTKKE